MKRYALPACAGLAAVVLWMLTRDRVSMPGTIEYRGEPFKLTRTYVDYDDYKDDPNNIDPSENFHVEQAVIKAPVLSTFQTRKQMIHAMSAIQFPGYGLGTFGGHSATPGEDLVCWSIEIPRANKSRIVVFRGAEGRYVLIDDFIGQQDPYIMGVHEKDAELIFSTLKGSPVLARPVKTEVPTSPNQAMNTTAASGRAE